MVALFTISQPISHAFHIVTARWTLNIRCKKTIECPLVRTHCLRLEDYIPAASLCPKFESQLLLKITVVAGYIVSMVATSLAQLFEDFDGLATLRMSKY